MCYEAIADDFAGEHVEGREQIRRSVFAATCHDNADNPIREVIQLPLLLFGLLRLCVRPLLALLSPPCGRRLLRQSPTSFRTKVLKGFSS